MSFKIGFTAEESYETSANEYTPNTQNNELVPRKSVVQISFEGRHGTLAYYNDSFDLKCGDLVYVDGKLEGHPGRVVDVTYNFKIKISDYKRVIAVADTDVKGEFFMAGSHFVTFARNTLPKEKIRLWYKAPDGEEDEFVCGTDETSFLIDDLKSMNVSPEIAERGHGYYMDNKVKYICLNGHNGYAIVQGTEAYEVEFNYISGEVSGLTCSCFCSGNCKHSFAAMLQLSELLEIIDKHYASEYEKSGYFAAIAKGDLFRFAVDGKECGRFTL